jgi:hypothetical protein
LQSVVAAPDFEASEDNAEILAVGHAIAIGHGILDEVVEIEG